MRLLLSGLYMFRCYFALAVAANEHIYRFLNNLMSEVEVPRLSEVVLGVCEVIMITAV